MSGVLLLAAGALIGYLVPHQFATDANDIVRRISATSCFQQGLPGIPAEMRLGSGNPLETEGIGPRHEGNSITLYCPIPSDSLLPHSKVDRVVLNGWNSALCRGPSSCGGAVVAYLCVSYASAADGRCTGMRLQLVRGSNYKITFHTAADLFPWRENPNGYPYLRVDLPVPSFNGDTNTLRGITISGPSTGR